MVLLCNDGKKMYKKKRFARHCKVVVLLISFCFVAVLVAVAIVVAQAPQL